MTSSKWITCCHRRSVQSESNHSSPLFTAKNVRNSTPNGKFHPPPPAQPQSLPYKPSRQDILRSSTSSNYSLLTQSTSPASSLSVYDLGRKSSSISSSSSSGASTSSTLNNDHHHQHHRLPVMKHSASTYDLSSPRRYAQNLRNQLASHHPHDDSLLNFMAHSIPITVQNTITIINPLECFLINCETNDDTKSAQISPDLDVIAVANDYWLAFYSIRTNNCLGMVQFPDKCRFWTWVRPETIALVTENDVYHWRLTNIDCRSNYIQKSDSPHYVFSVDENIKQSQIINYSIDPIFGYWCALSTLFIDDDGMFLWGVGIISVDCCPLTLMVSSWRTQARSEAMYRSIHIPTDRASVSRRTPVRLFRTNTKTVHRAPFCWWQRNVRTISCGNCTSLNLAPYRMATPIIESRLNSWCSIHSN